jgi:acyl-CoA thioesterase
VSAESPQDALALARSVAERMMRRDHVAPSLRIELDDVGPGYATVTMTVTEAMINGVGILHGGYIFLLADCAFAVACNSYGIETVARAGEIEFLRPARQGDRLRARASERQRLGRRGIYDVSVTGSDGLPVAEFRGHSSSYSG